MGIRHAEDSIARFPGRAGTPRHDNSPCSRILRRSSLPSASRASLTQRRSAVPEERRGRAVALPQRATTHGCPSRTDSQSQCTLMRHSTAAAAGTCPPLSMSQTAIPPIKHASLWLQVGSPARGLCTCASARPPSSNASPSSSSSCSSGRPARPASPPPCSSGRLLRPASPPPCCSSRCPWPWPPPEPPPPAPGGSAAPPAGCCPTGGSTLGCA